MKYIGIGDNVVDRYVDRKIMYPGGNSVNFSVYVHELGEASAYMGVLADDKEGLLIKESLLSLGVDISHCMLASGLGTERCDVNLSDGDRVFIGVDYGRKEHGKLKLDDENLEILHGYDVIHSGCYADLEDDIYKLRDNNAIKTYDFSSEYEFRGKEYLSKICPYIDVALFSDTDSSYEELIALKNECLDLGTKLILVTRGKDGQILFTSDDAEYDGVVKVIETVDTMGAGDSFFASFLIKLIDDGWTKGKSPDEKNIRNALEFAAEFSAQNCLRNGAFGFGTKY